MCSLCGDDLAATDRERERLRRQGQRIHNIGQRVRMMGNGALLPHSDEASKLGDDIKELAIDLLKDWA